MTIVSLGPPAAVSAPPWSLTGLGSKPGHCSTRPAWPLMGPGAAGAPGPGWPPGRNAPGH
jgi:hypothetical protein